MKPCIIFSALALWGCSKTNDGLTLPEENNAAFGVRVVNQSGRDMYSGAVINGKKVSWGYLRSGNDRYQFPVTDFLGGVFFIVTQEVGGDLESSSVTIPKERVVGFCGTMVITIKGESKCSVAFREE